MSQSNHIIYYQSNYLCRNTVAKRFYKQFKSPPVSRQRSLEIEYHLGLKMGPLTQIEFQGMKL